MTHDAISIEMVRAEAAQLAHLIEDFRDLVGPDRDVKDPAVARLAPNPYPDDEAAASAFHEATRVDILDRRAADADTVLAGLAPLSADLSELTETEALAPHELSIAVTDVDAWLRTLAALRLVVATRLGVDITEDARDEDDSRFGLYDWLGYRLELVIQAADEVL